MILNYLGIYYIISNGLSIIISAAISFFLNKKFVFQNKNKKNIAPFSKFMFTNIVNIAITSIFLYFYVDIIGMNKLIGVVFSTMIGTVFNYLLYKFWVFQNSEKIKNNKN